MIKRMIVKGGRAGLEVGNMINFSYVMTSNEKKKLSAYMGQNIGSTAKLP